MFKNIIFLASGAFSGNGFGNFLSKLEDAGFFSYVIPFLLLFAVIFGILTKIKIFQDNKSVNGIISFAVALMALQFDFVSQFFSQVFPRLGVGLGVILIILIILGLFTDRSNNTINWILFGVSVFIIITVLLKTSNALGWDAFSQNAILEWISQNMDVFIGSVILISVVAIIVNANKPKATPKPFNPNLWRSDTDRS